MAEQRALTSTELGYNTNQSQSVANASAGANTKGSNSFVWVGAFNGTKNNGDAPRNAAGNLIDSNSPFATSVWQVEKQISTFNGAELRAYNHSLDEWRTHKALMHDKKAEGKAEVVKAMKQKGNGYIATIAELTGLGIAEVE
jgi:hypothetical protein